MSVGLSPHVMFPLSWPVGDRFRETYYWDSYWVIRGLIVSKMVPSAKFLVQNLLYMLNEIGFVPNGARVYYLNRRSVLCRCGYCWCLACFGAFCYTSCRRFDPSETLGQHNRQQLSVKGLPDRHYAHTCPCVHEAIYL